MPRMMGERRAELDFDGAQGPTADQVISVNLTAVIGVSNHTSSNVQRVQRSTFNTLARMLRVRGENGLAQWPGTL